VEQQYKADRLHSTRFTISTLRRGRILLEKKNKQPQNLRKKWLIRIGGFFALQLLFIAIDGTILDPKLNDFGNSPKKYLKQNYSKNG